MYIIADGDSGSSSSDEDIDTTEDNSDHPGKIHPQDPPFVRPIPQKCSTKDLDIISSPPITTKTDSTITQLDEEMPVVQSSQSVVLSVSAKTTIEPSTTLTSQSATAVPSIPTVPPLVSTVPSLDIAKTTLSSAPLMIPNVDSSSNLVVVPSNSTAGPSTGTLQAVPFLMQTPNGVGYVSTPDGMLLGLLQGPNISQPQLVAIPLSSLGDLTSSNVKEGSKSKDGSS
ncbi:unnamed protein product [Phaedon cochleariae]|uniref:Uncharacterized protein n=1 Tax=Phaedon cochleariae TaxID=80249 RepID=A0A9N9X4I4_PHACE|nr:unnamed protein product [Phaedon cochleariae]